MLLVLNVAYHGMVAAHVARDLHRCKAWASNWLKRYDEEGIGGLRDRPKSGRHSQMSEQTECKIKAILKESSQGRTTKQVESCLSPRLLSFSIAFILHSVYSDICECLPLFGLSLNPPMPSSSYLLASLRPKPCTFEASGYMSSHHPMICNIENKQHSFPCLCILLRSVDPFKRCSGNSQTPCKCGQDHRSYNIGEI